MLQIHPDGAGIPGPLRQASGQASEQGFSGWLEFELENFTRRPRRCPGLARTPQQQGRVFWFSRSVGTVKRSADEGRVWADVDASLGPPARPSHSFFTLSHNRSHSRQFCCG